MTKTSQGTMVWRAAPLVFAIMAAACAPAPEPTTTIQAAPTKGIVEKTYSVGFASISEKYIEPVTVADVAVEGLKGFGAIDPALTVSRKGDSILLLASGTVVASFPAPRNDDAEGWAALTLKLSAAGRSTSTEMKGSDSKKIYQAVFDGVLSNLDIYSRYADIEEARKNRAKRQGFGGIGIRLRVDEGVVRVTQVMPKTPAQIAGLIKGDIITHIGQNPTATMKTADVVRALRGAPGTRVALTVARKGQAVPLRIDVERAHIVPTTVYASYREGLVVLRVTGFNKGTASDMAEELRKARVALGASIRGVVLDLRGNPGGLLKQSVKVADLFLSEGQIVSTRGRHPDSLQYFEAGGSDLAQGLPIAVLVDGKSASAAEIVAAALQDQRRAVVIGTSSFGKGTVQTVIRLPNDGEITLTWSRLVTPSGYALHGLGVRPSVCTSGATGDAAAIIAQTLSERVKTSATLDAWRRTETHSMEERAAIRTSCPAERRKDKLDLDLASALLVDRAQYARALDLVGSTAEAEN